MRCAALVVLWVCLAAGGLLQAAQEKRDSPASPETTGNTTAEPNRKKPRQSQKPAIDFKPSEKIRADSAVSFPVDI